ncbi:hydrogenase maturation protease [Desulfogranum mediterraneum]|uniref:hydrogenase maturation protease n=1 Tax=Desulfogranum mediterraneum TaxID=160661 RepID=UPI0003F6F8EB|nr:hydrogenase maturation protease [Desulfogranum mediterraneum]
MEQKHQQSAAERAVPTRVKTVIFGCGNIFCGDDGFGPAVIAALEPRLCSYPWLQCVDAGTSIREYLFDYLLAEELRPEQLIIVDSVDQEDRRPGEVFVLDPGEIPGNKLHDFSLHQFPTVNMLHELQRYTRVRVAIVVAQVGEPVVELKEGLSPAMEAAIAPACTLVATLTGVQGPQDLSRGGDDAPTTG